LKIRGLFYQSTERIILHPVLTGTYITPISQICVTTVLVFLMICTVVLGLTPNLTKNLSFTLKLTEGRWSTHRYGDTQAYFFIKQGR
jgi:hypothetical protein